MNTMQKDEEKAGWTTRLWRRGEIDIIRPWWGAMLEAGYGGWDDGPAIDEISCFGILVHYPEIQDRLRRKSQPIFRNHPQLTVV